MLCILCVFQKLTSQFIGFDLIGEWTIVTAINWLQVGAIPLHFNWLQVVWGGGGGGSMKENKVSRSVCQLQQ